MKHDIYIGSKSGIDPGQLKQRIEIQLRLEKELAHPWIDFRYIEIQPPANLNRVLTNRERDVIDQALEKEFLIGFEFPHVWRGRDIDPCVSESMDDILEIAHIARELNVSYVFTNPGDIIRNGNFTVERWEYAKEAHLEALQQMSEIYPVAGIENTNPLRHLESEIVYGFWGMVPEDLVSFDFIVFDMAHAQFAVNHFHAEKKIESIAALQQIHMRENLLLEDYIFDLKEKIQVVHVANAIGLGDLNQEGLKMSEGDADCGGVISKIIDNRTSPIRFIAEPSPIPYGLDYYELGELMYLEEKEIFEYCHKHLQPI